MTERLRPMGQKGRIRDQGRACDVAIDVVGAVEPPMKWGSFRLSSDFRFLWVLSCTVLLYEVSR